MNDETKLQIFVLQFSKGNEKNIINYALDLYVGSQHFK